MEMEALKQELSSLPRLKKKVKLLEKTLEDVTDSKLYYKRNVELKKSIDDLKGKVGELEQKNDGILTAYLQRTAEKKNKTT